MVSRIPGYDGSKELHKRISYVLESYDRAQLFHFILQLQKKADLVDKLKAENERLEKKVDESAAIREHWKTLHKHLEENPTLKEEWDNLCMAIKLTEDEK